MTQYKFDCFVHGEHYETNDLQRLLAFMNEHKTCGDDSATHEETA